MGKAIYHTPEYLQYRKHLPKKEYTSKELSRALRLYCLKNGIPLPAPENHGNPGRGHAKRPKQRLDAANS